MSTRRLIVTADDFGRSDGVNRGVASAHEYGIVTSASLMVRWPAAEGGGRAAREPCLGSASVSTSISGVGIPRRCWEQVYAVVEEDPRRSRAEGRRQLALFRAARSCAIHHISIRTSTSTARSPCTHASCCWRVSSSIPLRHCRPGVEYRGDFHGQTATGEPLAGTLTVEGLTSVWSLSPGTSELACHPAGRVDFETAYGAERLVELDVLGSPRAREAFEAEDVSLVSFEQALGHVPTPDRSPTLARPRAGSSVGRAGTFKSP